MLNKTIRYRDVLGASVAVFVLVLICPLSSLAAPSPYWTNSGYIPLSTSAPSAGLTISLNKGSALSGNAQASAAFDLAAQYVSSWIADPITMTIGVDLGDLGGKLGTGNPIETGTTGYSTIKFLLESDQEDHVGGGDITDSLPAVTNTTGLPIDLPAGVTVLNNLSLSTANAKALGFSSAFLPPSDGTITIDDGVNWDYDPTDGISAGQFDFFGVAVHEISHIMGFFSTVDLADALVNNSQTGSIPLNTLDLFRIAPGSGCTNFSGSIRQLSPGTSSVTYLGECTDAAMSTGELTGDGRSASHWKDGLGLGLLDPTFAPGEATLISAVDLRALDLIGWDVVTTNISTSAVPVPAALWLMMSGLGLFGFVARRSN